MERQTILDKIEEIQDYCEENNIGLNEERLECREMIADYIEVIVSELKTSDKAGRIICPNCNGSGVIKDGKYSEDCMKCYGVGQIDG